MDAATAVDARDGSCNFFIEGPEIDYVVADLVDESYVALQGSHVASRARPYWPSELLSEAFFLRREFSAGGVAGFLILGHARERPGR